jgi:hypothetical protein
MYLASNETKEVRPRKAQNGFMNLALYSIYASQMSIGSRFSSEHNLRKSVPTAGACARIDGQLEAQPTAVQVRC